jgi:Cu/Zn superoxide dismutase
MYKSRKQQGFFHTAAARAAGITPAVTHEFDQATKGHYGDLPEIAPKAKKKKKPSYESFAAPPAYAGAY